MELSQRWFLLIVVVILGYLLVLLGPILSPFIIGALMAYLADPVTDKLQRYNLSRTQAVLVVFSIIMLFLFLTLVMFLPKLSAQLSVMVKQIPVAINLFEQNVLPFIAKNLGVEFEQFDLNFFKSLIKDNMRQTGSLLNNIVLSVANSSMAIVAWLANAVLIPVVLFYLLRDWDIMMEKIRQLLPRDVEPKITALVHECDEVLGAFIKGQLMVMLALGTMYSVGLWLVGLDLALILGMIAGAASIVPYMGFVVGIVAAFVAAMVQFNDPSILVWVSLVFIIGQALEGMLLTPLMVGDKIGLHPVAVIFAIMAGGQLFGFIGILIALPVAAVIMVFLRHLHLGYKQSALYATVDSRTESEDESVEIEESADQEEKKSSDLVE
ncbi:MAG: AI-2E family transporter [Oceanospirillaceae bacterium]|nr:AI-2E family transporter [Oceanospirillaceae bacterium]